MTRLKFLPWVLGVALLVATVAGARLLAPDSAPPGPPPGGAAAQATRPAGGDALIVHGTVAAEREVVPYALPPLLPAGRVAERFVKEGQEVSAGDKLYRFDDAAAQADVARAKAAVNVAKAKKELAEYSQTYDQPLLEKLAGQAITWAEVQRDIARQGRDVVRTEIEKRWKAERDITNNNQPLPPDEVARRVETDERVLRAESQFKQAEAAVEEAKIKRDRAKKAPVAEQVKEADAAVKLTEADLARAELVAREHLVTAKSDGVVARVEADPGVTVGPASRTPLLWLVPNGPRVVRADVVPDFAYKIQNRVGQKVTISDDNNPALTYEGEVVRVSGSFLPKRGAGPDLLGSKQTLVLEVVIAVKDAAPAGKSPLRVGQPVRVSIGQ